MVKLGRAEELLIDPSGVQLSEPEPHLEFTPPSAEVLERQRRTNLLRAEISTLLRNLDETQLQAVRRHLTHTLVEDGSEV